MDFADLSVTSDAVDITITHPISGEPLVDPKSGEPVVVQLHGRDSERYRDKRRKFLDEQFKKSKGKPVEFSASEIERRSRDTLLACVAGWKHIELDKKALEFNPENFNLLLNRCPWLEEQIDAAIADRANFMKTSSSD